MHVYFLHNTVNTTISYGIGHYRSLAKRFFTFIDSQGDGSYEFRDGDGIVPLLLRPLGSTGGILALGWVGPWAQLKGRPLNCMDM